MSTTRPFLHRLRACWLLLTSRTFALYVPEKEPRYRVLWQHIAKEDLTALHQWSFDRHAELQTYRDGLATILNINPGIREAE